MRIPGSLSGMAGRMTETPPELPTLDVGIHLLESAERPTGALQSLVLDHLLLEKGDAYWVDSNGYAQTTSLARLAPSRRILDRIAVARGFTAYQHFSLIEALETAVTEDTALVVLPGVDWFYRTDDFHGTEGAVMLEAAMQEVADLAKQVEVPFLISRETADAFASSVADIADHTIRYESTTFGPRFVGDDFETLVYPDGDYVQTTLTYWQRVLQARYEAMQHPPTEVSSVGAH